jgi:phosphoenolpyruvate carboxylase
VDTSALTTGAAGAPRPGRATHALVREGRRIRLVRRLFHGRGGR